MTILVGNLSWSIKFSRFIPRASVDALMLISFADYNFSWSDEDTFLMVIICGCRVIPHREKFAFLEFVALPDSPDFLNLATVLKSHHSLTLKLVCLNWTLINNISVVPCYSVISIHLLVSKSARIFHISLLKDTLVPSAIGRVEHPRKAANLLPWVQINDFTVNHGTTVEPARIFGGVVSRSRRRFRQSQLSLSVSPAIAIDLTLVSAAIAVRNTVGSFQVFEFCVALVLGESLLLSLHFLLLGFEFSLLCLNHLFVTVKL